MLLTYLCYGLIAVPLIISYFFVLKPFTQMVILKMKLGKKAKFMFFPIKGMQKHLFKSLFTQGDSHKVIHEMYKTDPQVSVLISNILIWPYIIFLDHTYVREIMNNHENYEKLNIVPESRLIYNGLLYTKGRKWKQQRKHLTRSFTFESLKRVVPLINSVVKQKTENITNPFKALEFLAAITGEVIIQSFFGDDMKNMQINGQSLQVEITDIFSQLAFLQKTNLPLFIGHRLFGQRIWDIIPGKNLSVLHKRVNSYIDFVKQLVQQRLEKNRERYSKPLEGKSDFLDIFLYDFVNPNEDPITLDEICQQFTTFFFAGTDTTAHTCACMLLQLGKDEQSQEEIRQEILTTLGDRDVSYDDVNELHKLTAFMNECLRARNPALSLVPRVSTNDHFIKDVQIKKGWIVGNNLIAQASRDDVIDNPQQFDWRRWLQKNPVKESVDDPTYVYTPFSAGGRNCIGQHMARMEVKIIMSHLLRNYRFKVDPTKKTVWLLKFLYSFMPEEAIEVTPIK